MMGAREKGLLVTGAARTGLCLVAAMAIALAYAAPAVAQTTHKYLYSFNTPSGTRPVPGGVDHDGNIYVYNNDTKTISRYDANGNPVLFSALGSNTIDGEGGNNCPAVPGDCDKVPLNRFYDGDGSGCGCEQPGIVAVDTSGGPTDGYIYVSNWGPAYDFGSGRVEVFDSDGRFRGEIDPYKAYPNRPIGSGAVSVDSKGRVYTTFLQQQNLFVPVDGNPAHDEFVGQLRFPDSSRQYGVGGENYSYVQWGTGDPVFGASPYAWHKYPLSAYLDPTPKTPELDLGPEGGVWGNGGEDSLFATVDPSNQHLFLIPGIPPFVQPKFGDVTDKIREFNEANEEVGQPFYSPHAVSDTRVSPTLAIDTSEGPDDGHIYVAGQDNEGNSVAVFSGPVVIPDVSYGEPETTHTSIHVVGTVDPAGAGPVGPCEVEYGLTKEYGGAVPCTPAAPFSDRTAVTANLTGLGVGETYHYRIVADNANGRAFGKDQTAIPANVLGLNTDPASGLTASSAILNGSLNPDGLDTQYFFQYGPSLEYGLVTPAMDAPPGSSIASLPGVELTALQAGRTYHYRLVASNEFGTTVGKDMSFRVGARPGIAALGTESVTDTSAELTARIDPVGFDTSYRFEYGETNGYGTAVPALDGELPGDGGTAEVRESIQGLIPGVVYHFRVTASNQWGTRTSEDGTFSFRPPSCPNSHVRQQASTNYLPDCRAYELVSSEETGSLQFFPGTAIPSWGGEAQSVLEKRGHPAFDPRVSVPTYATSPPRFEFHGAFGALSGENPPDSAIDRYVSTRSASGWTARHVGLSGDEVLFGGGGECSRTLGECFDFHSGDAFGSDPSDTTDWSPYLWSAGGELLGRLPSNRNAIPGARESIGDQKASPDFSHYVFSSRNVAFAPGGLTEAPGSVYDNLVANDSIQLISKRANGSDIEQDAGDATEYIRIRAVSTDGSHVLLSTESSDGPLNLYMRVNDAVTYEVSGGHGAQLVGVNATGTRVLFMSGLQLTPDDTDTSRDLFEWNESGDTITRLSKGIEAGNSDDCDAVWAPQCAVERLETERPDIDNSVSPTADAVLFYSPEQLDPTNPGVPNERNLYESVNGQIRRIATLDASTTVKRVQVSPDGNHIALLTDSAITSYESAGHDEMYVYNAINDSIVCASCLPSGSPPTSNVHASGSGLFMADDGRVFFGTRDSLVAQDTNGYLDVYEYVGGRPQLISAGTGFGDSTKSVPFFPGGSLGLEAVTGDGVDVYFSTFDTLVPQDHNGHFVKFYDARTNGGIPFKPPLLPCAAADECHGPGSLPAPEPQIGTAADLGEGGNASPATKKASRRKHARRRARYGHRRRHSRLHGNRRRHTGPGRRQNRG
jgi:hypothetical protein